MTRAPHFALPVPALLATLLAVGCASPPATEEDRPAAPAQESADKQESSDKAEASAAQRERALAAARREVDAAEHALRLEQVEGSNKVGHAKEQIRAAEHELQEARAALVSHRSEAELRTRRAAYESAEAESRLVAARADLAGLVRIYADEPEVLVKEEILRRKQADVNFAAERVELARLEREHLVEVELPAEVRELEEDQRAATAGVDAKQRALEASELGFRKSLLNAEHELLDAQDEVREAEEALAKGDA